MDPHPLANSFIPTGVFSLLLQKMTKEATGSSSLSSCQTAGKSCKISTTDLEDIPTTVQKFEARPALIDCRSALFELLANEGKQEQAVQKKRLNLEKTISQLKKTKSIEPGVTSHNVDYERNLDPSSGGVNNAFNSEDEKGQANATARMFDFSELHVSEIFRSSTAAEIHFKKKHQKRGNVKVRSDCEECGKSFTSAFQLREHIAIQHLKERNFKCDQCEQRFGRRGGLRRHVQMVHQNHLHKCPYEECDHPGYKCSKALTAHIRSVHTNVRPFVCTECEKAFVRKNDLKMHELTHRKDIEFTCTCGHSFRRQMYLKKHQKTCNSCSNATMDTV